MPRPLRSHEPDGSAHITVRGNREAPLFLDALDYLAYLERLSVVTARVSWRVLSFCLMPNHAHLLIDASVDGRSHGMQLLSGWYAQRFNRRHVKSGHTFQGRFGSAPTDRGEHLFEVVRYIALNPVRAGLCARPQDWRWSSYALLIGQREPMDFLDRAALLALFDDDEEAAVARLRTFVELPEPDIARR